MTWLLAAVSLRRSCCYLSATYNGAQCFTMEAGTKIHIPANKASVNRAVDLGKLLLELSTKFCEYSEKALVQFSAFTLQHLLRHHAPISKFSF